MSPLTYAFKTIPSSSSTPALPINLDVYLPPLSSSSSAHPVALPILFAFHPGGFISYGRDHLPPWVAELGAKEGWVVVSPDYRLLIGGMEGEKLDAGDCLEDCLDAYEWVVGGSLDKELEEKGVRVDKEKIAVVGFSIGGLLTQLLPSLLPLHLPPIKSAVSLYGVSRLTHPFYSTPRSSSSSDELKSLNLSDEFSTVCSTLFDKLWSQTETVSGELDYTPEQKRELEKVGAEGYRGMLWDYAVEHGLVLDVLLGKGVRSFVGQGKNDSPSSSTSQQHIATLTARIQPFVGPNSITPSNAHPPTFLIHGDSDTLVPFSDSIWSLGKLAEAGVRCKYVSVPGVDHGFDGAVGLVGGEGGRYDGLWREVGEWIGEGWKKE